MVGFSLFDGLAGRDFPKRIITGIILSVFFHFCLVGIIHLSRLKQITIETGYKSRVIEITYAGHGPKKFEAEIGNVAKKTANAEKSSARKIASKGELVKGENVKGVTKGKMNVSVKMQGQESHLKKTIKSEFNGIESKGTESGEMDVSKKDDGIRAQDNESARTRQPTAEPVIENIGPESGLGERAQLERIGSGAGKAESYKSGSQELSRYSPGKSSVALGATTSKSAVSGKGLQTGIIGSASVKESGIEYERKSSAFTATRAEGERSMKSERDFGGGIMPSVESSEKKTTMEKIGAGERVYRKSSSGLPEGISKYTPVAGKKTALSSLDKKMPSRFYSSSIDFKTVAGPSPGKSEGLGFFKKSTVGEDRPTDETGRRTDLSRTGYGAVGPDAGGVQTEKMETKSGGVKTYGTKPAGSYAGKMEGSGKKVSVKAFGADAGSKKQGGTLQKTKAGEIGYSGSDLVSPKGKQTVITRRYSGAPEGDAFGSKEKEVKAEMKFDFDVFVPQLVITREELAPGTPFSVDGDLTDPIWEGAMKIEKFKINQTENVASVQTSAYVTYDKENLYVGFICKEPNMGSIRTVHGRDGDVWLDDSVEVYMDPNHNHTSYFQVIVNANGTVYDAQHSNPNDLSGRGWTSNTKTKVKKGKDFWTVEMTIPFSNMGIYPQSGRTWGLNLTRNRQAGGGKGDPNQHTNWYSANNRNSLVGNWHDPINFGHLVFK